MRRLTVVWVVLIAGVAFSLIHYYGASHQPRIDPVRDHASFRTNDWGTKALRTLLDNAGLTVDSWRRPWTELRDTSGVLWVIDPEKPITSEEASALLAWVKRGGVAVFAHDASNLRLSIGGGEPSGAWLLRWLGWEVSGSPREGASAKATRQHPLLRDVSEVRLSGNWRLHQDGRPSGDAAALGSETVLGDDRGAVLAQCPHGQGRLYVLCDADALGNKWIDEADNVALAANLAFSGSAGRVWFDEYHHGLVMSAANDLDTRAAGRALWAVLVAALLFALGKFHRFGLPVPEPLPPRRAAIEYVRAFALIFERARRPEAMLESAGVRLRGRVAQVAGMPVSSSDDSLARAAALRRPGINESELARLLRGCRELPAGVRRITDAELLALTKAIARIEQELCRYDP